MGQERFECGRHGFIGPYHAGEVDTEHESIYSVEIEDKYAYIAYICPVLRPATPPPPPHGMVQVGVQGQGRGMPLLPHH